MCPSAWAIAGPFATWRTAQVVVPHVIASVLAPPPRGSPKLIA